MKKAWIIGSIAGLALLALYAITMTLLSGWEAAVEQFASLWFLYVPLAIGFGVQVGFYVKLRYCYHVTEHDSKRRQALTAGGSSAGVSMLACCAHHATDALPFLGLSGVSILLTRYQVPILIVSLGINMMGIIIMHKHFKKMATL